MADEDRIALMDLLGKAGHEGDFDFLREGVRALAQALMELEVSQQIGVERFEHSEQRLAHRNGYREPIWDTRAGTIELRIPKITRGSYFPGFLHPRRRAEQALVAVIQEAYVHGVSTRKVDELVGWPRFRVRCPPNRVKVRHGLPVGEAKCGAHLPREAPIDPPRAACRQEAVVQGCRRSRMRSPGCGPHPDDPCGHVRPARQEPGATPPRPRVARPLTPWRR